MSVNFKLCDMTFTADAPHDGRRLSRRVAGIAALILAVIGVGTVGVGLNSWRLEPQHVAQPGSAVVTPVPAPVTATPPIPPEDMLNGQYQLTLEDSRSTYVDSTASQWSAGSADHLGFIRFSTECRDFKCVATSTPPGGPNSPASGNIVETMIWASGEWSSRQSPVPDGDGIDTSETVLRPDGRGGFLGTTTDTIISGPHRGAQLRAPVLLTPKFDPANL